MKKSILILLAVLFLLSGCSSSGAGENVPSENSVVPSQQSGGSSGEFPYRIYTYVFLISPDKIVSVNPDGTLDKVNHIVYFEAQEVFSV